MEKDTFEVYFSAHIRSNQGMGSLQLSENVELAGSTFRDVSRVLERFHTFGERMRAELAGEDNEGQEDEPLVTGSGPCHGEHCRHVSHQDGREDPEPHRSAHGRAAYQAYSERVGHKSVTGEPLPTWEMLGTTIRNAWRTAAAAARAAQP